MKKIFILPILFLALLSCSKSKNDEVVVNPNILAIQGKWQYVEDLDYNPPGPYMITNGYILEIKADGTFTSNESPAYSGGTYTFSTNDIVDFTYTSTTSANYISRKKITSFSANELILSGDLSPNGSGCIEGCASRYSKITTTPTVAGKRK
jgi:hypothetical protein